MTHLARVLGIIFVAATLSAARGAPAAAADQNTNNGRDTLFQYSTIDSLLAGLYDGDLAVGDISAHGDFGLGTFNALDGEMIVVDGTVYQARGDGGGPGGNLQTAAPSTRVPFTSVTFFDADQTAPLPPGITYPKLEALLDTLAPNQNLYQAIRIDGTFRTVQLRVAPRQTRPYAPLAQVIGQQAVFELTDVRGTLVGLRAPKYLAGLNVPGYHFHFVTDDRRHGGHVFGLTAQDGTIAIDQTPTFTVALPQSHQFAALDLGKTRDADLQKVEKAAPPAPGRPVRPVQPLYAAPAALAAPVAPVQPPYAATPPAAAPPAAVALTAPAAPVALTAPAAPAATAAKEGPGFFETLLGCEDNPLPDHMRLRNQRHKAARRPSGKSRECD